MKIHKSPTRFKLIQRLAGLATALAMVFVSTGSAHARILFQDDDFDDIASEGIFLNFDGTPGTDTAKLDVDGSGNLTIDADGEIDTTDTVNFSGAAHMRIREAAFAAFSGASAPDCDFVGEIAVDTITDAIYVCTVTGAPGGTWVSADNNPVDGTSAGNTLYWNNTSWVESTALTNDGTDISMTGNLEVDGTITAGSSDIQITNAAGNIDGEQIVDNSIDDDSIDFGLGADQVGANDIAITDTNTAYTTDNVDAALDELASTSGAGIMGITDAGAYTAQTTVEGALQELYGIGPAVGTSDSNTLRWDAANSTWEEDTNLTVNDATNAVAIANGTSLTANGTVALGDGGDAVNINGTTANWDLTDLDFDIAGGPSEISLNADAAADDLTIEVTGAFDSSLVLQSTGTGSDAIDINATVGGIDLNATTDLTFTDQYDSLTFGQVSAGMGNDLLNATGEIFASNGTIGATIGGGETSTSLLHAINAVGTYATNVGAGANDDLDDVYNNGPVLATVDNGNTGYNITGADSYLIQDGGATIFEISGAGDINFDPTSGQNLDITTLGVGDIVLSSADNVNIDGATVDIDVTGAFSMQGAADSDITTTGTSDITLTAGDDMIFDDAQLIGTIQLSDTATDWDTAFTSDGIIDNINSLASLVGATTETLRFYPEYPDMVFDSSDRGKLESIKDATEGNSYKWSTNRNSDQAGIIYQRFELPEDFIDPNDLTVRYKTATATAGDNTVAVQLYNVTNSASCGTASAAASSSWTTATILESAIETGCTGGTVLDAGDIIEVRITLMGNDTNNGEAYSGYIDLDYN